MSNINLKIRYILITLLLSLLNGVGAFASTPWIVNPSDFQYDMSLYLDVRFDTGEIDYSKYIIAAFSGEECRGVAEIMHLPNGNECLYLRARSNSEVGENITFKYYNIATEEILPIEGVSIPFKSNEAIGFPSEPYEVIITHYYDVTFITTEGGHIDQSNGRIAENTKLTINAIPAEGYRFVKWTDGITDNPREIIITKDTTLKAEFELNTYKLIYIVDGVEYKNYDITYGHEIIPDPYPIKEWHTFSGWSEIPKTMPAKDVTITGSFTANKYKITYVLDGIEFHTDSITFGSKLTHIDAPTKEGHTFSGWSEIPNTMPAKDVTITGSFTANKYKITYVLDGNVVDTDSITFGTKLTHIDAPTKEGHTFNGWSEIPNTMPAKDVTITGSFTTNKYKITYVLDGIEFCTDSILYGSIVKAIENPTKDGYSFSGWIALPETMPAKDVIITGSFVINGYNLIYVVDGNVYKSIVYEYGATITPEYGPTKEGYTFCGWSDIPNNMPNRDLIVTGLYTINKYKLSYVVEGIEIYADSIMYDSVLPTVDAPTKEGHTFNGWSEIPNTMPAKDVTITGSFTINKYLVVFILNGEVIASDSLEYGAMIISPEVQDKEGYTFAGWGDIEKLVPAHDVIYESTYIANTYKVYYYVGDKLVHVNQVTYGDTIPNYIYEPTDKDAIFIGWIGEEYETMPAHDITFVANIDTSIDLIEVRESDVTIYNLKGHLVNKVTLKRGIYVINGKTVMIK